MVDFRFPRRKKQAIKSSLNHAQAQNTIPAPSTSTATTPAPSSSKPILEVAVAESSTSVTVPNAPYAASPLKVASGSTLLDTFQVTFDTLGKSSFPGIKAATAAVLDCIRCVQMAGENEETLRPLAKDTEWLLLIIKKVKNLEDVDDELKDFVDELTTDIRGLHNDFKLREETGKVKAYINSPKFSSKLSAIDGDLKTAINKFHGLLQIETEEDIRNLKIELQKFTEKAKSNIKQSERDELKQWATRELKSGEVRENWSDVTINAKNVRVVSQGQIVDRRLKSVRVKTETEGKAIFTAKAVYSTQSTTTDKESDLEGGVS